MVARVAVGFVYELGVEGGDLINKLTLKLKNIKFIAFAFAKLLPRFEQIFDRDDILIGMSKNTLGVDPPPQDSLARFGAYQTGLFALA